MAVQNEIIDISSSAPATQKPPPASHRLATQSASAALQGLGDDSRSYVTTGVGSLDRQLAPQARGTNGGFDTGKVAELWGPIGAGKSSLAFQTAVATVKGGNHVVWIDCAALLGAARLSRMGKDADSFHYIAAPTLSHLLALVISPPATFVPEKTKLLVIDGVNTLIDLDYPRLPFNNSTRTEQQKWQTGRRYAILGSLVTSLNKLAVMHDLAVIVTTGCSSRMRHDSGLGASIAPGVGGTEWESGVWSRVLVFRDLNNRLLGVQKSQGCNITPLDPVGDVRNVIGFDMTADGALEEHIVDLTSSAEHGSVPVRPAVKASPARVVRKRVYEEIADSEDEDEYGWADADEQAIATQAMAQPQIVEGGNEVT